MNPKLLPLLVLLVGCSSTPLMGRYTDINGKEIEIVLNKDGRTMTIKDREDERDWRTIQLLEPCLTSK